MQQRFHNIRRVIRCSICFNGQLTGFIVRRRLCKTTFLWSNLLRTPLYGKLNCNRFRFYPDFAFTSNPVIARLSKLIGYLQFTVKLDYCRQIFITNFYILIIFQFINFSIFFIFQLLHFLIFLIFTIFNFLIFISFYFLIFSF